MPFETLVSLSLSFSLNFKANTYLFFFCVCVCLFTSIHHFFFFLYFRQCLFFLEVKKSVHISQAGSFSIRKLVSPSFISSKRHDFLPHGETQPISIFMLDSCKTNTNHPRHFYNRKRERERERERM